VGLLILTVYSVYTSVPQYAPPLVWSKTYGTPDDDQGIFMKQTADGGYVAGGATYEFVTPSYSDENFWVFKTNSDGYMQWNRTFGGPGQDVATDAQQTSDGGYIITGWTFSYPYWAQARAWLIKTDADGSPEWNMTYSLNIFDSEAIALHVEQTSDGGYIVAALDTVPVGINEIWLFKTSPNGTLQWNETLGVGYAKFVHQAKDGGYVVAGYSGQFNETGVYRGHFFVLKTNATGNIEWNQTYGPEVTESWGTISPTSDGGYIIGETVSSNKTFLSSMSLIKINENGTIMWQKVYDGDLHHNEYCSDVKQTSDGGYVLAGWTTETGTGNTYPILVKTDQNGTVQWTKTAWQGVAIGANLQSVVQSPDGGYAVAGFLPANPSYIIDFWIAKLGATPTYEPSLAFFTSLILAAGGEATALVALVTVSMRNALHNKTSTSVTRP
jgi:hypothetical protein